MELYDVMRTTFSAREFTNDPLPDATLARILDHARFAPSGGNRQGWRVVVVRERATREALAALTVPAAKRYAAQVQNGENPWNTIDPPKVDAETIERTQPPARLTESVLKSAAVLVICVDLKVVASTDQDLDRVGVISGAGELQPGTVMGSREDGSNDLPLAVSGQVYGRVCLEGGAIEPGDLLVASSQPGVAMRAADAGRAAGAVVGKALEAFDSGKEKEGLVRMMVMLR